MGDTPKKARHDLDMRRRSSGSKSIQPSERFKPDVTNATAGAGPAAGGLGSSNADPNDRTTTKMTSPPNEDSSGLPAMGRKEEAGYNPFMRHATNGPPADLTDEADVVVQAAATTVAEATNEAAGEARRKSDALLLAARRAMAQGDLRGEPPASKRPKNCRSATVFTTIRRSRSRRC